MTANQSPSSNKPKLFCDICQLRGIDLEEIPVATKYCIDCNENQCTECSEFHVKLKASRHHKIVVIHLHVTQPDENSVKKIVDLKFSKEGKKDKFN